VKTYKRLFEQLCSLENLFAASREAMRGKRSKLAVVRHFMEEEKEVVMLAQALREGTYRHGAYRYFTIHEPKKRLVAAAPFRDRVVHHAVVRMIEPFFDKGFIEDSFACRTGKGTHAALRRCAEFTKRYPYALKCDVTKYFPSIDHQILLGLLRRRVADERVMKLIEEILASHSDVIEREWNGDDLLEVSLRPRGLPIGNLTSQFFANVYLNELDHYVKHGLRVRGYVRYVDDFILFDDNRMRLREYGQAIRSKLKELRLSINPDKYRLLPCRLGVDFVGFVCFANGRRKLRAANARAYQKKLKQKLWLAGRGLLPMAKVSESARAWVAHAAHAQSWGLRRELFSHI